MLRSDHDRTTTGPRSQRLAATFRHRWLWDVLRTGTVRGPGE